MDCAQLKLSHVLTTARQVSHNQSPDQQRRHAGKSDTWRCCKPLRVLELYTLHPLSSFGRPSYRRRRGWQREAPLLLYTPPTQRGGIMALRCYQRLLVSFNHPSRTQDRKLRIWRTSTVVLPYLRAKSSTAPPTLVLQRSNYFSNLLCMASCLEKFTDGTEVFVYASRCRQRKQTEWSILFTVVLSKITCFVSQLSKQHNN